MLNEIEMKQVKMLVRKTNKQTKQYLSMIYRKPISQKKKMN